MDADYIRNAEWRGPRHYPVKVPCPRCGQECETIYAIASEAFGCEHCVDVMDADTWREEGGREY